jgi:hypothetical protein
VLFTPALFLSTTRVFGVVDIDDANKTRPFSQMTRPAPTDAYDAVGAVRSDVDGVPAIGGKIGTGFLADVSSEPELSKRVVVTAAHVIPDPFNWFERDEVGAKPIAGLAIPHPGYVPLNTNDVALLLLAEPVTNATPLKFGPSVPATGTDVAFVGERNGTRVGLGSIGITPPALLHIPHLANIDPKTHVAEAGDSGGPILASFGGENLVVGVSSFVYRKNIFGDVRSDYADAAGVPISWPIYSGALRVDNGSDLNKKFVHGDLIEVRQPTQVGYDRDSLHPSLSKGKVLFANVSEEFPDKRVFGIGRTENTNDYRPASELSAELLGILNRDDLRVGYTTTYIFGEGVGDGCAGCTDPPPLLRVLTVGESGILNGQDASFSITSGGVFTSMFHNLGTLNVEPFSVRRRSGTRTETNPAWLVVNGPLLNEKTMTNNKGRVIISKNCIDCLGPPLPVAAGMADETPENGAAFIQTVDGELSIVWDETLYAQFPPFEVEGDVLVDGTVNVVVPDSISLAQGAHLRLFEYGGVADFSNAQVTLQQGGMTLPLRLMASNGVIMGVAVPEPASLGLLAFACIICRKHRLTRGKRVRG